jgi:hypothetical protein
VNEPYRPQQPNSPSVGPPPQQPFAAREPAEQVVRVWTKGRAIPLFGSACVLVVLAILGWLSIQVHDIRVFLNLEIILSVILVCGIATALRRKVTLTDRRLIVRKLFRTQVLPLQEITNVFSVTLHVFTTNPVKIELTNHRSCSTMSFGLSTGEAVAVIAKAAKAAGSPIDI